MAPHANQVFMTEMAPYTELIEEQRQLGGLEVDRSEIAEIAKVPHCLGAE